MSRRMTAPPSRPRSGRARTEAAAPAAKPAASKSLINKRYSSSSRFSRLIDDSNIRSGTKDVWISIKGWPHTLLNLLHLLELFLLNGLRKAGWSLRSPTPCCSTISPYHHHTARRRTHCPLRRRPVWSTATKSPLPYNHQITARTALEVRCLRSSQNYTVRSSSNAGIDGSTTLYPLPAR
jgi:hypothetical protein